MRGNKVVFWFYNRYIAVAFFKSKFDCTVNAGKLTYRFYMPVKFRICKLCNFIFELPCEDQFCFFSQWYYYPMIRFYLFLIQHIMLEVFGLQSRKVRKP